MKSIFVTGIGTEIGKTFVIRQLLHQFNQKDQAWSAVKPIVSGLSDTDIELSDTGLLLKAQGLPFTAANLEKVSPWRFQAPLSPHLAAEKEDRTIPFDKLIEFCRKSKSETGGGLLIEGVGGVMVPINRQYTVLDWIEALHIPCLVVTGTYLGAINHTLLTISALRSRNIAIDAIIVNESIHNAVSMDDTIETIQHFVPRLPCHRFMRQYQSNTAQHTFEFMS